MKTSELDYDLPRELIAQHPAPERDSARMLVLRRSDACIEHARVSDLAAELDAGDLVIANDSRVFPARVYGARRDTGGRVELLFVEEKEPGSWEVMLRTRGRAMPGLELDMADGAFTVKVVGRMQGARALVELSAPGNLRELLERFGTPPLPPYIRRGRETDVSLRARDLERYQTVYAGPSGSIAAPTAGLHFTPRLLAMLRERGVGVAHLTLHVGPGTFMPVKSGTLAGHKMESERYFIPRETAAAVSGALAAGRRTLAVGTTVVRTLETAAVGQGLRDGLGRSSLFIYPGFRFRVVNAMLTNFHLPRSTPLAMVCALAGSDLIKRAYAEAIRERYRFYSYGDCMLIL